MEDHIQVEVVEVIILLVLVVMETQMPTLVMGFMIVEMTLILTHAIVLLSIIAAVEAEVEQQEHKVIKELQEGTVQREEMVVSLCI
jgi:mannose/fructose/N-acetylgalactosamine-specific phosphotransferase system component IIC